jgi:7-carboxy-7-deazaguanine synthase
MEEAEDRVPSMHRALKIVVFDELDLDWADWFMNQHAWSRLFLSVGTDPPEFGETLEETRRKVCDRYRWLCEQVPNLASEVTVYPQLHVLAYGHMRGV